MDYYTIRIPILNKFWQSRFAPPSKVEMDIYPSFLFILELMFGFKLNLIKDKLFDTVTQTIEQFEDTKEIAMKEGSETDENWTLDLFEIIRTPPYFSISYVFY